MLTNIELRVARATAEALTNREIARRLSLSPHTVDSHLRHIYAKLAVNSRVGLARIVAAKVLVRSVVAVRFARRLA